MLRHLFPYRLLSLLVFLAVFWHCTQQTDPEPGDMQNFPVNLVLTGSASGIDGGFTVNCECELLIEIKEGPVKQDGYTEYRGIHGGHFVRTALRSDGSGISLMPDVFGEVIVRLAPPDSVLLIFPANENSSSRFWKGIASFSGTSEVSFPGGGSWTCAPFDITDGGWIDTVGTAVGTWQLRESTH